jgi:hypothetical protein
MEQALAQRSTSAEWQILTFPFALRRASGVARKKRILWRGTQVVREGPLSSYASVRVRPAPSTFVFHGRREANASNIER